MCRRRIFLVSIVLLVGPAISVLAPIIPPPGCIIVDECPTVWGSLPCGCLIITPTGCLIITGRSAIDGCMLIVNGGTCLVDARFSIGQGNGGTLIMNGGTFDITGQWKMMDDWGGLASLQIYGGTVTAEYELQFCDPIDRDGEIIIGGGVLRLPYDYYDSGNNEHDPLVWLANDWLKPGPGYTKDDVMIYQEGNYTIVSTSPTHPNAMPLYPSNGAIRIHPDTVLLWSAGIYAQDVNGHEVYFGTDFNDVNDATTSVDPNNVFMGAQDACSYDPCGFLEFGQTYYWRIDEVNDACAPYRWRNETAPWVFVVDDGTVSNPTPGDGDADVASYVVLSWSPGPYAALHDVYLGTGFDDVNNANSTDHPNVVYDSVAADSYDPGGLELAETYYWRIDAVISATNYAKGNVWKFTVTDGKASNPNPADGAPDIPSDVVISWAPGDYATSHDVYLGTDWGDVNDANSTIHPNVDYNIVDANSYDPGGLALGETYYWRTDELIGSTSSKGKVWSFTTIEYIIVDDFESYDAENPLVYQLGVAENGTWIDGLTLTNGTGAFLQLVTAPNSLPTRGTGTMSFYYDCYNPWYINSFYAEGKRPITEDNEDWTAGSVKALSLWFHGSADNVLEQMYVALGDGSDEAVVKYHGDANDLKQEEWKEWNIDLQNFAANDVNLASINSLYIGFGDRDNPQQSGSGVFSVVYFDDIRLYIRRCVAEYGPQADLSGDCIVDLEDLQVMVMEEEWLTSGIKADLVDDDNVNFKDYAVLMDAWLEGPLLWPE